MLILLLLCMILKADAVTNGRDFYKVQDFRSHTKGTEKQAWGSHCSHGFLTAERRDRLTILSKEIRRTHKSPQRISYAFLILSDSELFLWLPSGTRYRDKSIVRLNLCLLLTACLSLRSTLIKNKAEQKDLN